MKQYICTVYKYCPLALAKILDPKQFPSRTLWKAILPTLAQGALLDVPELTAVHVKHFNPKSASHPLSRSPRIIVAKAVLSLLQ